MFNTSLLRWLWTILSGFGHYWWKVSGGDYLNFQLELKWLQSDRHSHSEDSVIIILCRLMPGTFKDLMPGLQNQTLVQDIVKLTSSPTLDTLPLFYCGSLGSCSAEWQLTPGLYVDNPLVTSTFLQSLFKAAHIHVWVKRIIVKALRSCNAAALGTTMHSQPRPAEVKTNMRATCGYFDKRWWKFIVTFTEIHFASLDWDTVQETHKLDLQVTESHTTSLEHIDSSVYNVPTTCLPVWNREYTHFQDWRWEKGDCLFSHL